MEESESPNCYSTRRRWAETVSGNGYSGGAGIYTHRKEVTTMQTNEERRDALQAEINQLCRETLQRAKLFLIEQLPAWHSNRLSRLVKTPKLHVADTGLACALLGITATTLWQDRALFGQLLETFVYQELRKQADWHLETVNFLHFRNKDGVEVDIVIEQGRQVAGIEVKASATVGESDFKGLAKLRDAVGKNFAAGILFYDGESILPFGPQLYAVPVSLLIGCSCPSSPACTPLS
jgi:hypothetical protein